MQNKAIMAVFLDRPPQSIRRTAMIALKVLHKKLTQACPFIHQTRLTALIHATCALLVGQRLSLTQPGRN
jgi:aminoglycoside phosphotransferase